MQRIVAGAEVAIFTHCAIRYVGVRRRRNVWLAGLTVVGWVGYPRPNARRRARRRAHEAAAAELKFEVVQNNPMAIVCS